ncbi:RloB family protein [Draconibacterium orientale]|uniref:RloB family protein n=1 Tax=Draconibacterium orientale TaxID=1168034 RepID=UPI0029C0D18B|nr:RloB family protein [Draconibacterium orientale]
MRKSRKIKIKGKKTYAFVVDGDTEVWYLQMLKRNERTLSVNIEPKLPSKKSIPDQFEMVKSLAEDYSKVFWIVDYDVIIKETREAKKGVETAEQLFIRLREVANKMKNVVVIVNNPCLEFWLLLHFEKTSRLFTNCNSAEKQLKKHLTDYEKTRLFFTKQNNDIYLKTKGQISQAINNSSQLNSFDKYDTAQAFCEMDLFFNLSEIKSTVCS